MSCSGAEALDKAKHGTDNCTKLGRLTFEDEMMGHVSLFWCLNRRGSRGGMDCRFEHVLVTVREQKKSINLESRQLLL